MPLMPIVDAWIQHPTPRLLHDPMFASIRRWTGATMPDELPLDLTLAALDAGGVDHALITAWWGPAGTLVSNDEVAAFVAAHPTRLTGLCSVDLGRPMDGVRELRRAVKQLGLRGLRLLPWLWGLPPND